MEQGRRKLLDTRLAALSTERQSYMNHWTELSEYLLPRRGRFLTSDRNKGTKKNGKIIDGTGTKAVRTMSAGMMSGITSPARPWFRLGTPDPDLMEYQPVKQWLFLAERRMRDVFNRSNFYNTLQTAYEEMGVFGTGSLLIDENHRNVIHCTAFTAGQYMLGTDHLNQVDTFARELQMQVGPLVNWFGLDNVSSEVRNQYTSGKLDNWIDIVQMIEPNYARDRHMLGNQDMAWTDCYFEKAATGDNFLRISGYEEFPIMGPRWHVTGQDIYGRSPGMDSLGDVKQLQKMQMRKAQAIDKKVNPPMKGPTSMKGQAASVLPGGVTYIDVMQGQQGFEPVYDVNINLGDLRQDIIETQEAIREGFYADLFMMLANSDRRQITAREIEERHEEKLLMLGPVLERLHTELLDPAIDRTFNIMVRNNMLPPPPEEIADTDLRVEYISVMAQAQRAIGIGSIERLAGFVGNLAGAKPEVLDKFDADQAVDEYAEMLGVPPKIVVPDDQVGEIREGRAQEAAMAQQMEQAMVAAQGAKTLSETDTGSENLLSQMVPGL